jgi:hypothetical protein
LKTGEIGKSGFLIDLFYFFAYLSLQTIHAGNFATQHPQLLYNLNT